MLKQKITISLDSEIAKKLRMDSIERYGDSRSLSRLIEDLATGAAKKEDKPPETCSLLGHRSEHSFKMEADFKKAVEDITTNLSKLHSDFSHRQEFPIAGDQFFALKEACELFLNRLAENINLCIACSHLSGPVPTYPDAGRNFEIYALLKSELR